VTICRALLLAAATGLVLVAAAGCTLTDKGCGDGFDAQAWAMDNPDTREVGPDGGRRPNLARQVEDCGFLTGKSKQEVRATLGSAPFVQRNPEVVWTYPLGTTDELGDSDYMSVFFGANGRVTQVNSGLD
jgi:hypothetical protein